MTNNPPAFPVLHGIDGNWAKEPLDKYLGMTLRDYFAGQIVAALAVNATKRVALEVFARDAYNLADVMLDERSKRDVK